MKGERLDMANILPVLPLRDIVVFPRMVAPLFVGRDKSVRALEEVEKGGGEILLVAQKEAGVDDPAEEDLYSVGVVATILQLLKLPDGTVKVLVEGKHRSRLEKLIDKGDYYAAEHSKLDEKTADDVLALVRDLVTHTGCSFLMVTHSERLAATLDRQVHLTAGRIT